MSVVDWPTPPMYSPSLLQSPRRPTDGGSTDDGRRPTPRQHVRVVALPQLPVVLQWPTDLADRQLADADRPSVAGAETDQQWIRARSAGGVPVRSCAVPRRVGRAD